MADCLIHFLNIRLIRTRSLESAALGEQAAFASDGGAGRQRAAPSEGRAKWVCALVGLFFVGATNGRLGSLAPND